MATGSVPAIEFLTGVPDSPADSRAGGVPDGVPENSNLEFNPNRPAVTVIHSPADVRELTADEVQSQIRPLFESNGARLPDPAISTFIGAVRDGKVVGFLCLQAVLHAEPMWIADGESAIFSRIVSEAERSILAKCGPQNVFLFAPAGRISQLAQLCGMAVEPWVVLSKFVKPDGDGTSTFVGEVH